MQVRQTSRVNRAGAATGRRTHSLPVQASRQSTRALRPASAQRGVCLSSAPREASRSPLASPSAWPRSVLCASAGNSSTATTSNTEVIRSELKALEAERDTAVSTAEACSKTATKLVEMARLLEQLAFDKVQQGDEAGAKDALREKTSVTEAIEKNSDKADANYKLAAALASKIASKQSELLATLRPTTTTSSATSQPASPAAPTRAPGTGDSTSEPYSSSSSGSGGAYSAYSGGDSRLQWKWQKSLEEARERLQAQEARAATDVRMAKLTAAESIAAAQQRIQEQTNQSLQAAQERLRAADLSSQGTLEAAQARLRARDEETLAYVRRIMARYRAGEYVSEDELEYAFRQLESRFLL